MQTLNDGARRPQDPSSRPVTWSFPSKRGSQSLSAQLKFLLPERENPMGQRGTLHYTGSPLVRFWGQKT